LEKNIILNLIPLASRNDASSARDNFQFFPEINSKVDIPKTYKLTKLFKCTINLKGKEGLRLILGDKKATENIDINLQIV
jgi:hypothetical protein